MGWGGAHLLRRLSTCQLSGALFAALCGSAQWQARGHADHVPRASRVHGDQRHCRAAERPRGPKRGARSPDASRAQVFVAKKYVQFWRELVVQAIGPLFPPPAKVTAPNYSKSLLTQPAATAA
eukprot:scaffold5537_cov63-Phaeocystis_antarctica.AAC.1